MVTTTLRFGDAHVGNLTPGTVVWDNRKAMQLQLTEGAKLLQKGSKDIYMVEGRLLGQQGFNRKNPVTLEFSVNRDGKTQRFDIIG